MRLLVAKKWYVAPKTTFDVPLLLLLIEIQLNLVKDIHNVLTFRR